MAAPILGVLAQATFKGGAEPQFPPAFLALPVSVLLALAAVGVAALRRERPARRLEAGLTIAGLVALAAGSLLLILVWLGTGVTNPSGEARAFGFLIIWPITMVASWLCGTIAMAVGGRWLYVVLYFVAWLIAFFAVWFFVASFLLNAPGIVAVFFFAALNAGVIVLAQKLLLRPPRVRMRA